MTIQAKLNHAEEVAFVVFPADHHASEIVQPSEESPDFPAEAVAPYDADSWPVK